MLVYVWPRYATHNLADDGLVNTILISEGLLRNAAGIISGPNRAHIFLSELGPAIRGTELLRRPALRNHVRHAPPANHWRWLVIYESGHQHLEDDERTGEWQRALAGQDEHGRIVALQIIGASTATVSVPEGAAPVMRRRRAIHFEVATGKQWQLDGQPMIVGWERDGSGCYLYCYPNGEVLLTDDLNVGAGHAAD